MKFYQKWNKLLKDMTWDKIKEKILEAVIHALVIGIGLVVVYSISIVMVGDAKMMKLHNDSINREAEIIARVVVLEELVGKMPVTNKPPVTISSFFDTDKLQIAPKMVPSSTVVPEPEKMIESLRNIQQVQKQYRQDNIQKN